MVCDIAQGIYLFIGIWGGVIVLMGFLIVTVWMASLCYDQVKSLIEWVRWVKRSWERHDKNE